MKGRSASKIKLTSYDELLGGGEETNDIQQVSLEHLHSFENHPFQVNDDEAMAELVESVKEEGILTALLVRPLGDGEYEIIAGHRRRHAAQLAGLKEVPVIIRNMDQDTAVRAMVDSCLLYTSWYRRRWLRLCLRNFIFWRSRNGRIAGWFGCFFFNRCRFAFCHCCLV